MYKGVLSAALLLGAIELVWGAAQTGSACRSGIDPLWLLLSSGWKSNLVLLLSTVKEQESDTESIYGSAQF